MFDLYNAFPTLWSSNDFVRYYVRRTGNIQIDYAKNTRHIENLLRKFDQFDIKNTIDFIISNNIHSSNLLIINSELVKYANISSDKQNDFIEEHINELIKEGRNKFEILDEIASITNDYYILCYTKLKLSDYRKNIVKCRQPKNCYICNAYIDKNYFYIKEKSNSICFECLMKIEYNGECMICPACLNTKKLSNGKKCDCFVNKVRATILQNAGVKRNYWYFGFNDALKNCEQYIIKSHINKLKQYYKNTEDNIAKCNHLLLYGGISNGKTSLAVCIAKKALLVHKLKTKIISFNNLIHILSSFDLQKREFLKDLDLIVIDSFGLSTMNDDYTSKLISIMFDDLDSTLIMTTDMIGKEISKRYSAKVFDKIDTGFIKIKFKPEKGAVNRDFDKNNFDKNKRINIKI